MRKGEIAFGSLSGLSFAAALDAYVGTGTSSWLADICFSGDAPAPLIEDMPMEEDHSKHAAYFASAGLTFLAAALGWEYITTQGAKLTNSTPCGTHRKRILACIIYVVTAANSANKHVIESSFKNITSHELGPSEAKNAFDFLMGDTAPELHRILAGASKGERQTLLRAVVQTWSMHGMDSEQSTAITERIVALLEFDQDDMRTALDRLWLKDQASTGLKVAFRASRIAAQTSYRATLCGAKTAGDTLAPLARHLTTRALVAIKR